MVGMYMQAVSDGADVILNCALLLEKLQMPHRISDATQVSRLFELMRKCAARLSALGRE